MVESVKEEVLKYKNYLLLQGPKGFFFYKLGKYLQTLGKTVYKINFNGGDLMTYPTFRNVYNYRDKLENFEEYLRNFISTKKIEIVLLYGDYKVYHRIAVKVCKDLNIPLYVFEEGYIRPYYITLEKYGINGFSQLPKDPEFYRKLPPIEVEEPLPVNFSYLKQTLSRAFHYICLELLWWYFPNYVFTKNYRPYLPWVFCWIRGLIRKPIYLYKERPLFKKILKLRKKYFLVVLQVHDDTQIHLHSDYRSVEDFIADVIYSFSRYADPDKYLVLKHHPVDRGFKDYRRLIDRLSERLNLKGRVFYIHDMWLPTLIKGSLGVITINSTVGLQALYHNIPVKVMGRAVYDIPGLTFQGSLEDFWKNPGQIDRELYRKFRAYVIKTRQLNGSFWGRFPFD
ncbi:MAG: capsule biosynthesis protein [Aquificaceae bacterium]